MSYIAVFVSGFYLTYEELKLCWMYLQVLTQLRILSYLWGIETKLAVNQLPWSVLGFYLTYEELKLYYLLLKSFSSFWILSYLWGIETRKNNRPKRVWRKDFILPMRNWNYAECICKHWYSYIGFYLTYEELKLAWEYYSTSIH